MPEMTKSLVFIKRTFHKLMLAQLNRYISNNSCSNKLSSWVFNYILKK